MEELIVKAAAELIDDWKAAQPGGGGERVGSSVREGTCDRWQKPASGRLKVNVDGAIFADERLHGAGVVLRDDQGAFWGLSQELFDGVPPPKEVEAAALLHAIQWVGRMQLHNVDYETDSHVVAYAVKGSGQDHTEFGRIIDECRRELRNQANTTIVDVRRNSNRVVHALARNAIYFTQTYLGEAPPEWLLYDLNDICGSH
ncbi:Putative ribonuclease H protein At1g65750 [Linum perenne]